jgi:hypothetical protein
VSMILRKLASEPQADLALAAFLKFRNLVTPGLMNAADLERRLVASTSNSNIAAADAHAAIRRGFAAAERKSS